MSTEPPDAPSTFDDQRDATPEDAPVTARDAGASAPPTATPPRRASGRPRPRSEPSGDTLLSAPAPADALDVEVDDRLRALERRFDDLEERLGQLDERRAAARAPKGPGAEWLTWVVLLLVLAVSWLLFHR